MKQSLMDVSTKGSPRRVSVPLLFRGSVILALALWNHSGFGVPASGQTTQQEEQARTRCKEGKALTMAGDWEGAVRVFEELLSHCKGCRIEDDALFWYGYNVEKTGKEPRRAFELYEELRLRFPQSLWTDDAAIHQVGLAEELAGKGADGFTEFLNLCLDDEVFEVRFQAALSLARLGDGRGVKVLEEVARSADEDLAAIANQSLYDLDTAAIDSSPDREAPRKEAGQELRFKSHRYRTYMSLKKTDEEWTEEELYTYGLWHILPEAKFDEYRALDYAEARQAWRRKFWKALDPTPTTPVNEMEEEFQRRVRHAKEHFSEEWDARQFDHLPEQYLRKGWSVAPWDSRGELYIKFGEPDFQTVADFQMEEWTYYRYNGDFLVRRYVTNVFGNGIMPGPNVSTLYGDDSAALTNLIMKPQFRYFHDYHAKPLKKVEIEAGNMEAADSTGLELTYRFPRTELKTRQNDGLHEIRYLHRYVIYDSEWQVVTSSADTLTEISHDRSRLRDTSDPIVSTVRIPLAPGDYILALRLEDLNQSKIGIYKKQVIVERPVRE